MRLRLLEPRASPPFAARVALFVLALAALGATYAATGSVALQTLVVFAAALAYPAAGHVLGSDERDELMEIARLRNPPLRVLAGSLAGVLAWGGAVMFVLPDPEFGPWFLYWLVLAPWMELHVLLARLDFRRRGAAGWSTPRPLRDATVAGVGIAAVLGPPLAFDDDLGLGGAAATAIGCGAIVFAMTLRFARRQAASARGERRSA
jgi:hypothetical protein